MTLRRHVDVIAESVALAGRRVLEVGCGAGPLLGWLAARAAVALGIDPAVPQLEQAREQAGALVVAARAEALPFAPRSFEVVLFFNSLHHVPVDARGAALDEAHRVLVPAGDLCVIEPVPAGPWFELLRTIDDETDVREQTRAMLDAAEARGFTVLARETYASSIVVPGIDSALDRFIAADATRRDRVGAQRADLAAAFTRLGEPVAGGRSFVQPMRLHLLRPVGPS